MALKYAMTLDGKIATKTGASRWITNEESRNFVHVLRNRYSAILVGIGTVLADDPMLDCRLENEKGERYGRNPIRIICDSDLKIPHLCKIVKTASEIKTIVACLNRERTLLEAEIFAEKKAALENAGCEIFCMDADSSDEYLKSHVNLSELTKILGEKGIDSILIEGGSEIHYSALKYGIVNKIYAFVAPKLFGGNAKSPVGGEGVNLPGEAFQFNLETVKFFGNNVLLEYKK